MKYGNVLKRILFHRWLHASLFHLIVIVKMTKYCWSYQHVSGISYSRNSYTFVRNSRVAAIPTTTVISVMGEVRSNTDRECSQLIVVLSTNNCIHRPCSVIESERCIWRQLQKVAALVQSLITHRLYVIGTVQLPNTGWHTVRRDVHGNGNASWHINRTNLRAGWWGERGWEDRHLWVWVTW